MSTLIVEVVEIKNIEVHPNADRLDLATVKGWQCVCQKDQYKIGEKVVYIPIDSLLPEDIESKIFPPDSKVKLHKHRVKTIKLRGAISQGMIVSLDLLGLSEDLKIGKDVKDKLGINKYEPPKRNTPGLMKSGKGTKKQKNPNFRKYTSIENVKNYPDVLKEKYIICSEKVHGTNYRAGYVKYSKFNIFKKIWKWLGYGSEYELVFGSHNIQLQGLLKKKTFYKKNVYLEMVGKYNLKEILKPNEVIYAEIYGDGIQKGYTYGCLQDEHKMVVVDVMIEGKYIDTEKAIQFCEERELPYVPVLYKGVFDMETFDKLMKGTSKLSMTQPIKEGLVITASEEQITYMGRAILKYLNPKYLLKNQTDWH